MGHRGRRPDRCDLLLHLLLPRQPAHLDGPQPSSERWAAATTTAPYTFGDRCMACGDADAAAAAPLLPRWRLADTCQVCSRPEASSYDATYDALPSGGKCAADAAVELTVSPARCKAECDLWPGCSAYTTHALRWERYADPTQSVLSYTYTYDQPPTAVGGFYDDPSLSILNDGLGMTASVPSATNGVGCAGPCTTPVVGADGVPTMPTGYVLGPTLDLGGAKAVYDVTLHVIANKRMSLKAPTEVTITGGDTPAADAFTATVTLAFGVADGARRVVVGQAEGLEGGGALPEGDAAGAGGAELLTEVVVREAKRTCYLYTASVGAAPRAAAATTSCATRGDAAAAGAARRAAAAVAAAAVARAAAVAARAAAAADVRHGDERRRLRRLPPQRRPALRLPLQDLDAVPPRRRAPPRQDLLRRRRRRLLVGRLRLRADRRHDDRLDRGDRVEGCRRHGPAELDPKVPARREDGGGRRGDGGRAPDARRCQPERQGGVRRGCVDAPPPAEDKWANPTCADQLANTDNCEARRDGSLDDGTARRRAACTACTGRWASRWRSTSSWATRG